MPDVELILKADNSQYVNKVREAQKATQNLYNTIEQGDIRQKGLIEQQVDRLTRLKEVRQKAYDPKDIAIYNNAIADANKKIKEYETLGVKANESIKKSGDTMLQSMGKWVLGIASLSTAMNLLKTAFLDTVQGMNLFNTAGAVAKQVLYGIVTGSLSANGGILGVIKAQKELNKLRVDEYKDTHDVQEQETQYYELYTQAIDQTKTATERLSFAEEALVKHNKAIDIQIEHTTKTRLAALEALAAAPDSEAAIKAYWAAETALDKLDAERVSSTRRLRSLISGIKQKQIEDVLAEEKKFQEMSLKLADDYDKTQIELLEGNDKIRAQRDYGLKQLEEFRKQMEKLGKLSKEQEKQFAILGAGVWMAFYEGLTPEAQKKLPQKDIDAISKMLLPQLQGLVKKDVPAEMAKIKAWVDSNKEFSIWNLLGLDPNDDEDKEAIEAVKNAAEKMQNIFEEILDKRVELAQRERELLDTRISETQREIDLEAELMKEGFANNLTARQQYLEQLKKQREQALADEDKAIKQQLLAQKLIQTTNILSGVSEIIKTSAKYPVIGMILAAASIASLFAIWSQSKSKATKLEEGGSGTVTGKRHSQGGERFLDHVEIEQGEQWGVLSRRASGKYGDMFHDMVSSFNKDQMPEFITPSTTNLVRVDNNGPNSRLDRVIKEQEKMNTELRRGQLYTVGNKRILKSGNKIRIIG